MKTRPLMLLILASGLFTALAGAEENIGRVQTPLISDVVVNNAEKEALGLLEMNAHGRGCSATLLTNSWVLSASHCMDARAMRVPNNVQLNGNWGANAQIGNADYIYRSWGLDYPGVMYDFALIHLQRPMRVNGSTTGYVRELTGLSLEDMKNVNVAVYGRGMNVLAVKNGNNFMASSGDGEYRSFVFTVNRIEPNLFWYPAGPNGEMVGGGDSGGPSFEVTRGVPRIAGVHAQCHAHCLPGRSCPVDDQWTWVSKIDECGDAPMGNLAGAIHDFMQQPAWNPAMAVQTVQVRHSESQVRKDMLLGHIDTLPWDYVRRVAMMACHNRGFDFGFFDGNSQPGVRYQARCVNASAGRWYDAGPAEMMRINDRFATIAQTGWAQAARAANDLCRHYDATAIGGLLTGHERKTQPAGGFADQRNGVFCFNNANAAWFDSTLAEHAANGMPVGDLNQMNWGVAGRAATEYCRKKFYGAGGFFNGHQVGDKRGVVCIRANAIVADRIKVGESYGTARAQAAEPARNPGATSGLARGALVTEAAHAARAPSAAVAAMRATPAPAPAAVPVAAAPAVTMFYSVEADGSLSEYRHDNPETGAPPNRFAPTSAAWNTYDAVIPAGGNHFYARAQNGDLFWYQHDGFNDGANTWRGPVQVGNGWQGFTQIFGGGNGVIYAIAADGSLLWYRHAGFANGDARAWLGPKKIGTGWQSFKHVFSAGHGAIYAITQDGRLMLYRHLDPANGEMRWSGPTQAGTGWNGFAQVFSTGNGVIYGLAPDGKLSYYRHLTWNAAQPSFQWVGAVPAGESFNPAAKMLPILQ